jgi:hypothetical protein
MRYKYASTNLKLLPESAEKVIESILEKCEIESALITSTIRSPADQARIMYDNLEAHGIEKQRKLYKPAGNSVTDVYEHHKAVGEKADAVKKEMAEKIIDVGPEHVSAHCVNDPKKGVFDIAPSSIPEEKKKAFINQVTITQGVTKFLRPPIDPAFHIEIKVG